MEFLTQADLNDKIIARFWKHVCVVDDENSCWLWLASCRGDGYGQFNVGGWIVPTHKLSYVIEHGTIPADNPFVLHTCNVRRCVRPLHLYAGTQLDNMRDMKAAGGYDRRLNQRQADEIRALYGTGRYKLRELAEMFGVSIASVGRIKLGECW